MPQDYHDILQPFDHIVQKLRDAQPSLGIEYVAELDETLLPAYPAVLVQTDRTERQIHGTHLFRVVHYLDLWVFHHELTVDVATRSRKDIQLATDVRKLLHSDFTLGGHVIFGFVDGEFPGISTRVVDNVTTGVVTTRLTWTCQNRVPFDAS